MISDSYRHMHSRQMVLTNFINVFTKSHMLTYFKNSIIVLIGVLIPLLLFALMAGFALSKNQIQKAENLSLIISFLD